MERGRQRKIKRVAERFLGRSHIFPAPGGKAAVAAAGLHQLDPDADKQKTEDDLHISADAVHKIPDDGSKEAGAVEHERAGKNGAEHGKNGVARDERKNQGERNRYDRKSSACHK